MSVKNYDSTMYNSHDGIMSTERDQNLSLTDTNILSHSLAHKDLVSPKIWIPISLAVAFMNAVSNEIKSKNISVSYDSNISGSSIDSLRFSICWLSFWNTLKIFQQK